MYQLFKSKKPEDIVVGTDYYYHYSLYVDGKLIITKKMVLIK